MAVPGGQTSQGAGAGVDQQLQAFLAAERTHESGGDYTAYNAAGGASGAYQFIQSTWTSWANRAGQSQYADMPASQAPPAVQDAVAAAMASYYYQQFGNWKDVAEAWYYPAWAGNPAEQGSVPYPSAGNTLSIGQYGDNVVATMNQYLGPGGSIPTTPDSATGGGNVSGNTNAATGQALSMSDIPAVIAYIKTNWPSFAWLLDVPEVATILEQGAVQGLSTEQVQAKIDQTTWWRTTSQAVKTFEADQAQNPAEYNFNTPGSKAAQSLAQIQAASAQYGVTLTPQSAQQLALNALKFGWTTQQTQAAIGSMVTVGANGQTNAAAVVNALKAQAGQYLMDPNDPVLQSWAQNVAAGTQTMDQYTAWLKQNASLKWTGMASQIAQGYTPNQIVNNLRTKAAQTMEVDPNSIDFINDPQYSKILDYVPPNTPDGVHRLMTESEMTQYLKGTDQWQYTQQSRDQVSQVANTVLQAFGKVG